MTPAERLADRIAKNREIDRRISEKTVSGEIARGSARKPVRSATVRNTFDKFQQIKRTEGLDAAAEYVRARKAAAND